MINSSNSSVGKGNTKPSQQESPKKNWCFTVHNYEQKDIDLLNKFLSSNSSYIMAKELGKSGETPHLQGFASFKTKQRFSALIKLELTNKAHWEPAKGTKDHNINYIMKENGTKYGDLVPETIDCLSYDQLYKWQRDTVDLIQTKPDHRTIWWLWGPKNMGKTEIIRYLNINYKIPFSYGGSVNDVINLAFNNIKGAKAFIFSLTRSKKNKISYDALEQLKDGCISNNKFETGCFCINRPHIFVFANEPPEDDHYEEKLSSDRLKVIKVSPKIKRYIFDKDYSSSEEEE